MRKFLDGRCDEAELREVSRILADRQDPGLLDRLMEEEAADEWNSPVGADGEDGTDRRLAEAHKRIRQMELTGAGHKSDGRVIKFRWLRYAAVFAGALLLTSLAFFQLKKTMTTGHTDTYVEQHNPKGIPVRYILPDSSEVYLGAGSKLAYPDRFEGDRREITLEGEAFFSVTHMPDRPFIVRSGEVSTRVLGTSFKVEAFDGLPLEVAVATGKVAVSKQTGDQAEQLALLTPGLKIVQNPRTGNYEVASVDIGSLNSWKSGELVFDKSLELAVQELQRRYGADIRIADPEIGQHRMIGTFSAGQPLADVLELMSFVGKFRYQKKNENSYIIYNNK